MLHDPEAYPDPEAFRPERFLTASGAVREDPLLVSAFGYGRRCVPAPRVSFSSYRVFEELRLGCAA